MFEMSLTYETFLSLSLLFSLSSLCLLFLSFSFSSLALSLAIYRIYLSSHSPFLFLSPFRSGIIVHALTTVMKTSGEKRRDEEDDT